MTTQPTTQKNNNGLVQPIVVLKSGSHLATVQAAMLASLTAALQAKGHTATTAYKEWLAGAFTKTVRRGTIGQLEVVETWAETKEFCPVRVTVEDSVAIALAPLSYKEFPKELSKLQVSGTNFPRTGLPKIGAEPVSVTVYFWEELSTGKAAAQASHALWLWSLSRPAEEALTIASNGQVRLVPVSAAVLEQLETHPDSYPIRDFGLTEVDPMTLTAVAQSA